MRTRVLVKHIIFLVGMLHLAWPAWGQAPDNSFPIARADAGRLFAASNKPMRRAPFTPAEPSAADRYNSDSVSARSRESAVAKVLRWGNLMLQRADSIQDYSCTLIKREQIAGKLGQTEYIHTKVRHRPFSVSLEFLAPHSLKGRQAVWVKGKNNGKLLANGNGFKSLFGTVSLEPTGQFAMQGNRHPITETGIRNIAYRMIATTQSEAKISKVAVTFRRGAKVGDRPCTYITFRHGVPRRGLRYHVSRIFVDEELALPIRFEGYTWPRRRGDPPVLVEEYTYQSLKLNNGFRDTDFQL